MSNVTVIVNGSEYRGWKEISIQFGIEQFVPSFSLSYTEAWPPSGDLLPMPGGDDPDPILEGDDVELRYKGRLLLTGYVDEATESYDSESHSFRVEGRAKTADLVDCSASAKATVVRGKNILAIAEQLYAPFDVSVELDPLLLLDSGVKKKIERFRVQEGESPFEAVSRLTGKRGLLQVTQPDGNVLLTRSASVPSGDIIRRGVNVLRGSRTGSARDRFSQYVFKSQTSGTDLVNGKSAAHLESSVSDGAVMRYRPTVVVAEHQSNTAELKARATWDRNVRAGRAERFNYTLRGWEALSGVWQPNTVPAVSDDDLGVQRPLLLASVELIDSDNEGEIANVECCGVGAYDVLAAPTRVKRAS